MGQCGHHIFDTQPHKIPLHIFPPSFTVKATITDKQVLGNLLHGGSSGISTQISTLHHSSLDHIMQSLNHGIPSSLQMASSTVMQSFIIKRFNHLTVLFVAHCIISSFTVSVSCRHKLDGLEPNLRSHHLHIEGVREKPKHRSILKS